MEAGRCQIKLQTQERRNSMGYSKEELIERIEAARVVLNRSIDERRAYEEIYEKSVALDSLIEQYIDAGY